MVVRKMMKNKGATISNILIKFNFNVLDLNLTTTPSVQMAIITEKCIGGIMVSASHNPINWNGLKFLNSEGEFLSKKQSEDFFNFQKKIKSLLNYGTINSFDYKEKFLSKGNIRKINLLNIYF